jgi:hypothetical protein
MSLLMTDSFPWGAGPKETDKEFIFPAALAELADVLHARSDAPVEEQPVVYFGTDGDACMIARDLGELLWYFANGFRYDARPDEALRLLAERHAPGRRRSNEEIETAAEAEFPGFSDYIDSLRR